MKITKQQAEDIKGKAKNLLSWRSLSAIDYVPSKPSLLFDNLAFSKWIDSITVEEKPKGEIEKIKTLFEVSPQSMLLYDFGTKTYRLDLDGLNQNFSVAIEKINELIDAVKGG